MFRVVDENSIQYRNCEQQGKGIPNGGTGYCKATRTETCKHRRQTEHLSPINAEYKMELWVWVCLILACSSSNSRRSSSRSASPSSFSPQHSRSGPSSARRAGDRGGRGRGTRARARGGQRSRLSVGSDDAISPEKKQHQPAGRRGGRKPLSSRLGGPVAKKKGYSPCLNDAHTQSFQQAFLCSLFSRVSQCPKDFCQKLSVTKGFCYLVLWPKRKGTCRAWLI